MTEEIVIDFLNWQTMVIELFIAGIVATWFFWRQKQQSDKIEKLVTEISTIEEKQQKTIEEQEKSKKTRREFSIHFIRSTLPEIEYLITEKEKIKKKIMDHLPPSYEVEFESKANQGMLDNEINNLKFQISVSSDVLEPHNVEDIRHLVQIVNEYTKFELEYDTKAEIAGIKANIQAILNSWPNPPI